MPRTAYVNGRYVPHRQAAVHIEDRGYQFADGVYEVVPVFGGTLVDEELHLDRLERSLRELRIAMPMSRQALKMISAEVMRRNGLTNGLVYMQVTRGVAPRDHKFPKTPVKPAVVMTVRQTKPVSQEILDNGIKVVSRPDIRWQRRDIKSTSLLPNCLAKQEAHEAGAYEAWLVEPDGTVTEGTSTNAWIVTKDNKLVTRSATNSILNGITRISLLKVAAAEGIEFEERPFTLEEALEAREAFTTASSIYLLPVTEIDGKPIGNGHPGILSQKLRQAYIERVAKPGAFQAEAAA